MVALGAGGLESIFTASEIEGEEEKCGTHKKVMLREGSGVITLAGKPTEAIDVSEI